MRAFLSALCLALATTAVGQNVPLVLNEIVSSNVTGLPDEYEVDLENCPVDDCARWFRDLGESQLDGDYPDWIELHNPGQAAISLAGYGLSDEPAKPLKWLLPETSLPAGGYLVVFASGKNLLTTYKGTTYLHTNFRLRRSGETVTLAEPQGRVLDQVKTGEIPLDLSLGRALSDPAKWIVLAQPTPGQANNAATFGGYTEIVAMQPSSGFHEQAVQVTLSAKSEAVAIRYTTDGSEPRLTSPAYEGPISVAATGVVRARAFRGNQPASPIVSQTYFIRGKFTLPVVSLSTDPAHFFDPVTGIYAPGKGAREADRVANYWKDWERPVHVEFFEADGKLGFQVDAGAKIFGWGSRANPQRSLSLFLRDKYGYPELEYPLFPGMELRTFQAFTLRAGGTDAHANGTFFRDQFASSLVGDKDQDVQATRPAILYINGRYWGIQDIREKMNEHYLAAHHGVNPEEVDIVSRYWRRTYPVLVEGAKEEYISMEGFLEESDMSKPENYLRARELIDMDHFITYGAAQVYYANVDWPGNNNKNWKARSSGKWRWLMYDLDYTFAFDSTGSVTHNTLQHALAPNVTGWPNPKWTTLIMRKLAENEAFRHAFANRMCDFANTIFLPDRAVAKLEAMKAIYAPEMPEHINRWKGTGDVIASMTTWERNIQTVRTFLQRRPTEILKHVRNTWKLGALAMLEVAVSDPAAGTVRVNSIVLDKYPWQGSYFTGVPITLRAIPKPGYKFTGWSGATENMSPTITLLEPQSIAAKFTPDSAALNTIVITEINYHSNPKQDTGDWVELYNGYAFEMDVSGWSLRDGTFGHHLKLPEGTSIPSQGYLVLCQNTVLFRTLHPEVRLLGDFSFGLGNAGDTVRLLNAEGGLVDAVTFADRDGWPTEADGAGSTLVLRKLEADNSRADQWAASARAGGSPGLANELAGPKSTPPNWQSIARHPDGRLRLELRLEAGSKAGVETSDDLKVWTLWQTVTGTGSPALLWDEQAKPKRYYRARPEAP